MPYNYAVLHWNGNIVLTKSSDNVFDFKQHFVLRVNVKTSGETIPVFSFLSL